jgi:hypothetical protein
MQDFEDNKGDIDLKRRDLVWVEQAREVRITV